MKATAGKPKRRAKRTTLRTAPAGGVQVSGNTIKGVSVITAGEALGHGFDIDTETLKQVAAAINAGEVPARVTHSENGADPLMQTVGIIKRARVQGDQVRADVELMESHPLAPWLLEMATRAPASFGMSIVFDADFERVGESQVARIKKLVSADFVSEPGANRNGLLSKGRIKMSESELNELRELLGLDAEATGADIVAAIRAALEPEPEPDTEPDAAMSAKSAADAIKLGAQGERNRVAQITFMGERFSLSAAWVQDQITSGASIQQALAAARKEVEQNMNTHVVSVGENRSVTSLTDGIRDGISLRVGGKAEGASERARYFATRPIHEAAREYLRAAGEPGVELMSPTKLIERAFVARVKLAQSTSDFPNLLGDGVGRTLRAAYEEFTPQWALCFGRHVARDFRTQTLIGMLPANDLTARSEGGGLTYHALAEEAQTTALREYVAAVKFTRQALVNDDLGGLDRTLPGLAMAARRLEDSLAFGVLESNPTVADGKTLFASDHASGSNYLSSGTGAPSVAELSQVIPLLRRQTAGASGANVALEPKFLIAPVELEGHARVSVGLVDPALNTAVSNPWSYLTPVITPHLSDTDAWYVCAAPQQSAAVMVVFLAGEEAPVLRQETDFDTEDVKLAVRHSVAAVAVDWRAIAKSAGTS